MFKRQNLLLQLLFVLVVTSRSAYGDGVADMGEDGISCHGCVVAGCADGPGESKPCKGECGVIKAKKGGEEVALSRACMSDGIGKCAEKLSATKEGDCFKFKSDELFKDDSQCKEEVTSTNLAELVGVDAKNDGHEIEVCLCKQPDCNGDKGRHGGKDNSSAIMVHVGKGGFLPFAVLALALTGILTLRW